jgi:hypothetical protein
MKYSFKFFTRFDSGWNGRSVPSLVVEDHESYGPFFSAELNNLRLTYLEDEILPSLEKVFAGALPEFRFGYEVYDFACDRQTCKVFDYSSGEDILESELDVQDIYKMLKEWGAFLRKWRDQERLAAD